MKKNLVCLTVLFFLLFLSSCWSGADAEQAYRVYPETAAVVELDESNDVVTVQSAGGIKWSFLGCSDYGLGDMVSLLMEANDTPEIADDMVLQARYAGYVRQELISPIEERIQTVSGKFYYAAELEDLEGNREMLYQFRSDDDSVWWLLSAEEIGFVPELLGQSYYLAYDNSGTTPENKGCDCPPEYDCECEVYDDVFISVSPVTAVEEIVHMY